MCNETLTLGFRIKMRMPLNASLIFHLQSEPASQLYFEQVAAASSACSRQRLKSRHLNNLPHCAFCRHMQTCKNLIGCIPTRMGGLGSLGIFIACYIGLLLTYNTAQKFYITSYIVYVMTDWNIAVVYETMLHHILYSMFPRYKHNTWMIFWFQDTLLPHSCHLLIKIFRGTLRQLFSPWLLCWRTFFWLKIFLETHSAHQSSCE